MKRIIPLYRYLLWETVKPVGVFYAILLVALTGILLLPLFLARSASGEVMGNVSGLGVASTIFLFVTGLNSFKSGFLFASANGFTRRQYHLAVTLMLFTVATFMSLIDAGINAVVSAAWPGFFAPWPSVYTQNGPAALELWQWTMNLLLVGVGLCTTMAFYRLNKIGKFILGFSPMYVSGLVSVVDQNTGYTVTRGLTAAMEALQGIGAQPNALIGVLSMAVGTVLLFALARLLIHGAAIKEQDR